MKKMKRLNEPKIKCCFFDEKGKPIRLMPLKEPKRDPNEIVKVMIMPADGNIWLYDKESYNFAVRSSLGIHPVPQIEKMT